MRAAPACLTVALVAPLLVGCAKKVDSADPEFSDAVRFVFREFEGAEVDLAFGLRDLEAQIDSSMDITAKNTNDRALAPEFLSEADIEGLEHEDRDLQLALPVAVAALSPFPISDHTRVQMLVDQTVVEPYSPDHYDRSFLEGDDCWEDRGCDFMRTVNELTKENFLMTLPYDFNKDFRWIDMNLPDPSAIEDGADPENGGEARWAFVGRSWTTKSFAGEKEDSFIHQSYTIEVWIPQSETETLRMLCLWSESEFVGLPVTDDQVIATTRSGIDTNFNAADTWLEENPG